MSRCPNSQILPICRGTRRRSTRLWHYHCPEPHLYGAGLFRRAYFGWSRRPIIELVIPSTLDGTLAPRGQHVASLFCQHVAPKLSDGSSWDDDRETVADLMVETKRSMIMHRISGARFWHARSFPFSTLKEHSDLSTVIFFTERSICGKSSRHVRCWATRMIEVRSRVFICAVREAIREVASPVRQATMPLGKSCATSSASASTGRDST